MKYRLKNFSASLITEKSCEILPENLLRTAERGKLDSARLIYSSYSRVCTPSACFNLRNGTRRVYFACVIVVNSPKTGSLTFQYPQPSFAIALADVIFEIDRMRTNLTCKCTGLALITRLDSAIESFRHENSSK